MHMRFLLTLSSAALMATGAAAAPPSVRDFRLPPAESPDDRPQVQGPVDTEGPVRRAPRVIANDPPAAASEEPATAASPPRTSRPIPRSTPGTAIRQPQTEPPTREPTQSQRLPTRQPATPTPPPAPAEPRIVAEPATNPIATETSEAPIAERQPNRITTPAATIPVPDDAAAMANRRTPNWVWAALLVLIAILGGMYGLWQRRRQAAGYARDAYAPESAAVRPSPLPQNRAPNRIPNSSPELAPQPVATASKPRLASRVPVQVKAEAHSLTRSFMNATFVFSLDLRNLGTQPLRGLTVQADLVTAHGKAPLEEQLAGSDSTIAPVTKVDDIAAQQSHRIDSEFRLPVNAIRTIAQGKARLFVPLLRVRIAMEGRQAVVRTFVVGILPPNGRGKLLPFRLDEMAQTYRDIGLRALD